MKRLVLLAMLLVGLLSIPIGAQSTLNVGIDQVTRESWTAVAAEFQDETGMRVSFRPYPQVDFAQQIVIQQYLRTEKLHLVMIHEGWGALVQSYLADLKDYESRLQRDALSMAYLGGKLVGVWIPFAPDWFLAVLSWPEDRDAAVTFLELAAKATDGSEKDAATVSPQGVAANYRTTKINRADHNPKIDGSLAVLLGAAEDALGTLAAEITARLPQSTRSALEGLAILYGVPFSPATSTVTVVLESPPGRASANVAALSALGVDRGAIEATTSLIKVSVPLGLVKQIAAQLGGITFIRPPYVPYPLGVTGQGVAAIGADAFHAAGITGSGAKVAIIDLGFAGLSQAQARGDVPTSVNQHDLTGTGITSGITHGTAVAEIVHEIAPGAELYLIKIGDEVDLDQALTYCQNNGIDIINHSLGWYNTNFYDGTGTIAEIAKRAIQAGMLWVNAAGNEAESHWEGSFTDGNTDSWHDQSLSFHAGSGSQVILYMTWDAWPQASSDYDLYLYDPASNLVASSTKHQTGTEEPTESIITTVPASGTYTVRIKGSGSKKLEIYNLYHDISPTVAASSILAPANVGDVVTIGAIDHAHYTTGPQESYSSQGPTNDGRAKPDLCAPDNVTTGTSPYSPFLGTSGAAPHAAGAAALLLSQELSLTEPALRARLLSQAVAMGSPYVYGRGRLSLSPPSQPNQGPTAAFTYSPASPMVGTTVTFDGSTSTDVDGTISSYSWSLGDGSSGTGVSVHYAYASLGTYTVGLTVTDDDGASDTTTRQVAVTTQPNQAPNASFTYSPSSPSVGTRVTFDGSRSTDVDGRINSYSWSFGDGTNGNGVSAQHTYAFSGAYTVTLTVTDDDGATDSEVHSVQVGSATPGGPSGYWRFNEGTGSTAADSSGNGNHGTIYNTGYVPGSPDGSTALGRLDGVEDYVRVANSATLDITGPLTIEVWLKPNDWTSARTIVAKRVEGSSKTNYMIQYNDGKLAYYFYNNGWRAHHWNTLPAIGEWHHVAVVYDGMRVMLYYDGALDYTSTENAALLPNNGSLWIGEAYPGSYGFAGMLDELRIHNRALEPSEFNLISAGVPAGQPPVAAFTYSPLSPALGEQIVLNAATSYDPDGTISAYSWSFGDGSSGSGVSVQHAYRTPGTYAVSLTVTDNDGASDTTTQQIAVATQPNQAPNASFTYSPSSLTVGTSVAFNGSTSTDADGTINVYSWSFGDGSSGFGVTVRHTYASSGTYLVRLTVTDNQGATDTTTQQATVTEAAKPDLVVRDLSYSPLHPNIGQSVAFTISITNQGSAAATLFRVKLMGAASSTQTYLPYLPALATTTVSLSLPLTRSPETFTVAVDDLNQVQESNEGNNSRQIAVETVSTQAAIAEAGGPYSGTVGERITFDGSRSSGAITDYLWTFGDGASGQGTTTTHSYSSPGTYSVSLTVIGADGQRSTDRAQVTITETQPSPALSIRLSLPKETYQVGEPIVIDYTINREAYVYICEVDANGRVTLLFPNYREPSSRVSAGRHSLLEGQYTLRVSEPVGDETLYAFAATSPLPNFPTRFGTSFTTLSYNPISFRDSVRQTMQMQVPAGAWAEDALNFTVVTSGPTTGTLWVNSFPPGARIAVDGTVVGTTPSQIPLSPGTHSVSLSSSGYQSTTHQVSIVAGQTTPLDVALSRITANRPPVAVFSVSPPNPAVGQTVLFDASGSYDSDGSILSYSWDFGDGRGASGSVVPHTYASGMMYFVRLTVTDDGGASHIATQPISVSSVVFPPPWGGIPSGPPMAGTPGIFVWGTDTWHVTVNAGSTWASSHSYRLELRTDGNFQNVNRSTGGRMAPLGVVPTPTDSGKSLLFEGSLHSGSVDYTFFVSDAQSIWMSLKLDTDGDGSLEESASFINLRQAMVHPPTALFVVGLPQGSSGPLVPSMNFRIGQAYKYNEPCLFGISCRTIMWWTDVGSLESRW